jgi:hypothetical protein
MKVHWGDVIFAVVMILLFLVFLHTSFGGTIPLLKMPELNLCSEYLQHGTIFQGQPYCCQGIVTYFFVFLLHLLSGGISISIPLYLFVILLLNLHALFLLLRIIRNETGKNEYFLTGILYLSMVYLFGSYFDSFLVNYFCLAGFYVLWHSKLKFRNILGPVLYAFALLSKLNAMPIVAFLIVYGIYKSLNPRIVSKQLAFQKGWQKQALIQLASFGLVLAAVFLLVPNSWLYEFGNYSTYQQNNFLERSHKLIDSMVLNSGTMFFGLLLLLSVIAWIFLHDVYSSAAIFSIAAWLWVFFNIGEAAAEHWPGYLGNGLLFATSRIDYYSAAFPFFIVAMAKLKSKISRLHWKLVVGILLALFLVPSIEYAIAYTDVIANHDANVLEKHFKKSLSLIPYQQDDYVLAEEQPGGEILIDKYLASKARIDLIPHNNTILKEWVGPADPAFSFMLDKVSLSNSSDWWWKEGVEPDPVFSFRLDKMHVLNLSDWVIESPPQSNNGQQYELFFSRLLNNAYTIIFVNTQEKTLIEQMINQAPNLADYCKVILPDLQHHGRGGEHALLLMFRDETRCTQLLPKVKEYYENSFADICARSPTAANEVVKQVLGSQEISLPECKERDSDPLLAVNEPSYWFNRRSAKPSMFSLILGFLLAWIALTENTFGPALRKLKR